LQGFYRRIGVADRIHWTREMTMIEPGGRRSRLGPFTLGPLKLPAPLHSAPSFLNTDAFTLADKLSLGRAMRAMMKPEALTDTRESLGDWLRRHKQTEGALNRFWRLVIASALNAEIDSIAVHYAAKVIRELFLSSADAGSMGMSTVPLTELYEHVTEFIAGHGGCMLLNTHVEGAAWDEASRKWLICTRTGELVADYVILALPFEAMQKLLPHLPAEEGKEKLARQLERHEHWPICSVHLWFDREITELEHAVLLDREIHWMYNQSKLQGRGGNYIELVVSATRSFAALPRNAAIQLALRELAEFFPLVKEVKLEKVALVKEMHATFGVPPGIDWARPHAASSWPHLFLAGDWTATGWPSTMESAARSGHLAAEALGLDAEEPLQCFEDDLKPQGLMEWIFS
jgi:zeta-carotene desaturase